MGKKRRILLAVLLVIVLGGLAWWLLRPREPYYKGKSLSAWLEDYSQEAEFTQHPDADQAVRQIGTNAIPTLLRLLRAKDSPLKTKSIEMLERQELMSIRIIPDWERNAEGFRGFKVLGAEASSAVPDLIRIYDESISRPSQYMTAASLGEIGPAAKSAVPTLLSGLETTNKDVRLCIVVALGQIHSEPEMVVPELVKLLHDSSPSVRRFDVAALTEFGTNAKSAFPVMVVLRNDPGMGAIVSNALKQIDPEAAARAGIK